MRKYAYLVLVALLTFIGYSAYAQQSAQSRPNRSATVQMAQAGTQSGVTTNFDNNPAVPAASTPEAAPAATSAQSSNPVDETALRYFARQNDTARVAAEIARLRSLHPGWEPPANLLEDQYVPDGDLSRFWELVGQNDYAGARAAIAAKQAAEPDYVVPDDLLAAVTLGEAGVRLANASDAKQYETVISVAANFGGLLTCDRVDNLWRLGEAFAKTGNVPRAIDAYSYVLTNCDDAAQRYATLQKASELVDRAALSPLLALERKNADGTGEFADLRLDLARRAIAASLQEDGAAPPATDVTLFGDAAEKSQNADDLRLIGYFEFARKRFDASQRWFEQAMEVDPSLASAQGLGTAELGNKDPEAAEATLADYRDENEELTSLYLDAAAALLALQPRIEIDSDVLERIVETVTSARHALAAQELGWYAYDFQQPQTAVEWFTLALRWQADLEPAAFGMMVASNALGDQTTVESIRAQWGPKSERIAIFGRTTTPAASTAPQTRAVQTAVATAPVQTAVAATPVRTAVAVAPVQTVQSEQMVQTTQTAATQSAPATSGGSSGTRGCAAFTPAGSLSANAALGYAWCQMNLNRPAQAIDHFNRALQSGSEKTRADAAYGLSLAYVRLGLADEASVAAASGEVSDRQALELEVAILSEKAVSAYNIGDYARALDAMDARARYAPERNDLLTLRAWSYFHLKRYKESQRIFEAVAATGYGDAVSGLAAATAALQTY